MALYEYEWFAAFIAWCRKWKWFDKYIYGKSSCLEDFVRNPAEVLRDTVFPFCIKNVKAFSILNARFGYIKYDESRVNEYCTEVQRDTYVEDTGSYASTYCSVPMGDRKVILLQNGIVIADMRAFNPWHTKFCNARFFIQLAFSLKWYIPIPYMALVIKYNESDYFQFGFGWGPQLSAEKEGTYNAVLCGKFRLVQYSKEVFWNPTDAYGYWEGYC